MFFINLYEKLNSIDNDLEKTVEFYDNSFVDNFIDELKSYLSKVASEGPQKERMMTQYWQLDAEPVESMAYWTESERYLREE